MAVLVLKNNIIRGIFVLECFFQNVGFLLGMVAHIFNASNRWAEAGQISVSSIAA